MRKLIMLFFIILLPGISMADETLTVYSESNDGILYQTNASFSTCRNATDAVTTVKTTTNGTSSFDNGQSMSSYKLDTSYYIFRSFFPFNTSELPDNAVITSATLYLYPYNSGTDSTVCAQEGTQGATLSNDDFDAFTGIAYGTVSWNKAAGAYLGITFNSTGIANINKAGSTYICVREYSSDYSNSANSTDNTKQNNCYYSEQTGTDKDPKLVITYTVPVYVISTSAGHILKQNESDATGAAIDYMICNRATGAILATGTSDVNGDFLEVVTDLTTEYDIYILDLTTNPAKAKVIAERVLGVTQ